MSENRDTSKNWYFAAIGFLYGLVLAIFGLMAAGAGHGTYVLTGIFSAPLGLIGVPAALIGAIILWLVVGLLIKTSPKKFLVFLLLIHYGGIFLILNTETYGDFKYFARMFLVNPSILILGLVVYTLGQVLIWIYLLFVKTKTRTHPRVLKNCRTIIG